MDGQPAAMGLVHLYVGDGKGKTTAALGLALRAVGAGRRVLLIQFLKGRPSCELGPLGLLGVEIVRTEKVERFVSQMTPQEREDCRASCRNCLDRALEAFDSGQYGLVILDEVVDAVNCGMVPLEALCDGICSRAPSVEVVLTGRRPPERIQQLSDYITQFQCLRHPYQKGIPARYGVEY